MHESHTLWGVGQQVNDLDDATESLREIGASQPDFQSGAGRWRVLLDPDGQPLCLSPRPAAAVARS